MTDTALILVDIQNDYFAGGRWPVAKIDEVSANAARLLADARAAGDIILHVHHEIRSENAPFFTPGTNGAKIHETVTPKRNETKILKHFPNSFRETNLLAILQDKAIKRVTVCGAMSQMCIDATARAAADFGFEVTVVEDACGAKEQSFDGIDVPAEQVHATIMAALSSSYAKIETTQGFISNRTE